MSNNIWFTADTHFGHSRIIQYCSRPFEDEIQMEEELIANFNSSLRPGDILYHLGDVAWSSYEWDRFFGRLNTNQIHLIRGNHDPSRKSHPHIRSTSDIKRITIGKIPVLLCHYALRAWPGRLKGHYHLYGHSHGNLPGLGRSMDVGVDTNGYRLWGWEDIHKHLSSIPIEDTQKVGL